MASGKNKKRSVNKTESNSKVLLSDKKISESLKPKPKIVKKSLNQYSGQMKEAKITAQVQAVNENEKTVTEEGKRESTNSGTDGGGNPNAPHGNKEKEIINARHEETSKRDQKAWKNIGGLILMCNAKTKPDCFHYHVMGVPTSKQELVMGIKPGLKLFLFDFDLKLMYGIYEASSAGGMKLEPAAFNGAFPAQVRFKVYQDCLPLPEGVFKKAIKDNYDEKKHKFKTVLTIEEVKKLTKLFRPVPLLRPIAQSFEEPHPAPIISPPPAATIRGDEAHREQLYRDHYSSNNATGNCVPSEHERKQFSVHPISSGDVASPYPFFLTEKEYRSYGLRRERNGLTTVAAPVGPGLDTCRTDQEREQLPQNPASISGVDAASVRKEFLLPDPLFLSEKEYRTYGLKGRQELPTSMPTSAETNPAQDNYPDDPYNPYHYSMTSLVDQYLSLPRTVAAPSESYSLSGREAYINDSNYMEGEIRNRPGRLVPDGERLYSAYDSRVRSDYNQKYQHRLGGETEFTSTPVSSRYSFASPSISHR